MRKQRVAPLLKDQVLNKSFFSGGSFDGEGLNSTYNLVTDEEFGGLNIRNGSMAGRTHSRGFECFSCDHNYFFFNSASDF